MIESGIAANVSRQESVKANIWQKKKVDMYARQSGIYIPEKSHSVQSLNIYGAVLHISTDN